MSTYFLDTSAVVKRYFLEQGHDWIVFICADNGLIEMAVAEQLKIENPNNY